MIAGTLCTVIGAVLDVEGVAVTAKGVPPFPPAVEVAMLPAVAMVEDGPALAIVAFVVLDADVLLSGAVEGVALAVEAVFVWAVVFAHLHQILETIFCSFF